jgi:hypothetical protein
MVSLNTGHIFLNNPNLYLRYAHSPHPHLFEAGATFDNSFFDNSFALVRQLKNRLFLGPVFVHVTGQTKN